MPTPFRAFVLSSTLLLSTLTLAQSSNNASAVFVYNGSDDTEFIFALNADKSTGDLYFHLSSPAGNTWVGVGIGSEMKDALMFIAYPSDNEQGVTISPRIGSGHTEPTSASDISIEKLSGNGLTGANTVSGNGRTTSNIIADGVCRSCSQWNGGSIDWSNTQQPFIFAVGPVFPMISSDSLSAGLSRHIFYGDFTMDMTAATSSSGGAVPLGPYTTKDASQAQDTKFDDDPAPRIHGLVMSFVFVIALPLGALLLRVWNKIKGHIIVQCIALVLFCMAFAGGCVVSMQYNRSKHFNSAHQIIGILMLLAFFAQLGLGAYHHRIFKREQRKTIFGKIHLYLGPAIIFLGVINGFLGFDLAGSSSHISNSTRSVDTNIFTGARILAIPYAIIVLIFVAIFLCVRVGGGYYRRRRNAAKQGPEGYVYPQFGNTAAPSYGVTPGPYAPPPGAPPANYPPPYSQQDVPLQRFESSQSVPREDSPAVQPRPMV